MKWITRFTFLLSILLIPVVFTNAIAAPQSQYCCEEKTVVPKSIKLHSTLPLLAFTVDHGTLWSPDSVTTLSAGEIISVVFLLGSFLFLVASLPSIIYFHKLAFTWYVNLFFKKPLAHPSYGSDPVSKSIIALIDFLFSKHNTTQKDSAKAPSIDQRKATPAKAEKPVRSLPPLPVPEKIPTPLISSDFVLSKTYLAKVLEKLANGTNSEVRRIEYKGREYAVKALLGKDPKQLAATQNSITHTKAVLDLAQNDEERARFIENHGNNLYDSEAPLHYVVMELVRGKDLRQVIQANPTGLPLSTALLIADEVLIALEIAHRTGKPIRDLKPENILLTENGDIKIADLGGLVLSEEETQASTGSLTPSVIVASSYGIPERKATATTFAYYDQSDQLADPRADLVAVGRLIEELVFGSLRGEAKGSMQEIFDDQLRKREDLSQMSQSKWLSFNLIYDRSQKVMKFRYASATTMREDLAALIKDVLFQYSERDHGTLEILSFPDLSDQKEKRKELLAKVPAQTFEDDRHLHYPRAAEVLPEAQETDLDPVFHPDAKTQPAAPEAETELPLRIPRVWTEPERQEIEKQIARDREACERPDKPLPTKEKPRTSPLQKCITE